MLLPALLVLNKSRFRGTLLGMLKNWASCCMHFYVVNSQFKGYQMATFPVSYCQLSLLKFFLPNFVLRYQGVWCKGDFDSCWVIYLTNLPLLLFTGAQKSHKSRYKE